jgi:hypothetical protein
VQVPRHLESSEVFLKFCASYEQKTRRPSNISSPRQSQQSGFYSFCVCKTVPYCCTTNDPRPASQQLTSALLCLRRQYSRRGGVIRQKASRFGLPSVEAHTSSAPVTGNETHASFFHTKCRSCLSHSRAAASRVVRSVDELLAAAPPLVRAPPSYPNEQLTFGQPLGKHRTVERNERVTATPARIMYALSPFLACRAFLTKVNDNVFLRADRRAPQQSRQSRRLVFVGATGRQSRIELRADDSTKPVIPVRWRATGWIASVSRSPRADNCTSAIADKATFNITNCMAASWVELTSQCPCARAGD